MHHTSRPWLIVFDLDGTLIDSSRDLCSSVNAALQGLGKRPLGPATITSFIGDGAPMLMRRALAADSDQAGFCEIDEDLFNHGYSLFLEFYRVHKLDTTRPYPGVLESLAEIRQQLDPLMAVLTNKPVRPSREICGALGLAPFFFVTYGGDSFSTKKPAPEGLQSIIKEAREQLAGEGREPHEVPLSRVVMVGDSEVDVSVARSCGVRSVGCSYGLSPASLRQSQPDRIVSEPGEWLAALGF